MNGNDDDDKGKSLREISREHGTSIISQLVDIGSERNQERHAKFLPFIRRLQCLQLAGKGTQLRRTAIDAFSQREYVALSYTWTPSKHEDACHGQYCVEGWDDHHLKPSTVRNCVFDRVRSYMRHAQVQLVWIDAHCIRQDTCGVAACSHGRCAQKRDALQAMDLVYQLSEHPVALLARPLQTAAELDLLARILSGKLVNGKYRFRLSTTDYEANKALRLLYEITRDDWWGRAWTFQENYRGGQRMRLLIRHGPSLERQKQSHRRIFGKMPGELCISSVTFATQATRLCLAFDRAKLSSDDSCQVEDVLRAAGRYRVMLPESSAMTPRVVGDIEERKLLKPWDRLAIIANCCQYPVRLDYESLSKQGCSLSLSVLAMCLLNGEILDNSNNRSESVASLKMPGFLEKMLFQAFSAPEDDTKPLTFNKGCRLTDVKLTADGILTKGHMWKLCRIIDTSTFGRKMPWIANSSGRLKLNQRKRLLQLALCLNKLKQFPLAQRIDQYLADDASSDAGDDYASFTEMYFHHMAAELAAAIKARRKLRLGSVWDPTGATEPYRAVFVWSDTDEDEDEDEDECEDEDMDEDEDESGYEYEDEDEEEDEVRLPPAYVFTSAWSRNEGSGTHDTNDIDRQVSLEVDFEEPPNGGGVPHFRVRKWLLGMCFFEGCSRTEVVFPWPRALQAVKPY
ncbi:hypothetical protein GGI43DRAFT_389416 [Trichoderma evansii]